MADMSRDFVFTRAPDAEFVWVQHPGTKGQAQVPIGALPFWAAREWEPCDPPDEIDPTRAHLVEAKLLEQEQADAAATADEEPAAKPAKKSGAAGTSSKGSD